MAVLSAPADCMVRASLSRARVKGGLAVAAAGQEDEPLQAVGRGGRRTVPGSP